MSKQHPKRFTVAEINKDRFYKISKELFTSELYKGLNSDARILYAILADRKELSRDNNWVDQYGDIYLIYTRENLAELIGVSINTVTKAFKILVKHNLVDDVRQGLNKPNRIYVLKIEYSVDNKGNAERVSQESKELPTNETELNETEEKIKRYIISETGNEVLSYYYDKYIEVMGKEHPTVTKKQLANLEEFIEDMDIKEYEYDEWIDEYFEQLPESNNGSVLAFIGDQLAIERWCKDGIGENESG